MGGAWGGGGGHQVSFSRAPETFETPLYADKQTMFIQKLLKVGLHFFLSKSLCLAELSLTHRGAPSPDCPSIWASNAWETSL